MLWPEKDSFPPMVIKIQLCLGWDGGGVASFNKVTRKVPTLLTSTVGVVDRCNHQETTGQSQKKFTEFEVVFCDLLVGIKVVKRSPFGSWYRKLCGEAGLEDSIIRNKMRTAAPRFWHCAGTVAESGQLVEHEFTGETGLNPLVWFEMVWLNHSSRMIFIMSLIIVTIYY